jgi:hypothetical protein
VTGSVPLLGNGALIAIEAAKLALGMYRLRCAGAGGPA